MFISHVLGYVITKFLPILEICRPQVYIGLIVVYSQAIEKCNPCALDIEVIVVYSQTIEKWNPCALNIGVIVVYRQTIEKWNPIAINIGEIVVTVIP